jgi:hypothetical protein
MRERRLTLSPSRISWAAMKLKPSQITKTEMAPKMIITRKRTNSIGNNSSQYLRGRSFSIKPVKE